jgi:hypothetical protein
MNLPKHRAYTAHLEHQPLERSGTRVTAGRQQLAGFLGQVNQDRTGG